MQTPELERLVRLITIEVLKAVQAEASGCGGCSCDQQGCCKSSEEKTSTPLTLGAEYRHEGRLLSEADILKAVEAGTSSISLPKRTIVTPLARDSARARGIELKCCSPIEQRQGTSPSRPLQKRLLLLAPKTSRSVEDAVVQVAANAGRRVELGLTRSKTSEAILEASFESARQVADKTVDHLVIIDEAVYAICHQLNRIEGIRPAICWDAETARQSRQDSNSNILLLNSRMLGLTTIKRIVTAWLEA